MDSLSAVQEVALLADVANGNGGEGANNGQVFGAGYREYLESPREDEWVLLHERQTWRNDATGWSFD